MAKTNVTTAATTSRTATIVEEPVIVNDEIVDNNDSNTDNENTDNEDSNNTGSKFKTTNQIVKELLANGAKKITGVRVRSAIATQKDNYVMVSLTLDKPVPAYVMDSETNDSVLSESKVIFASSYSIGAILKDSDDTAWAANQLVANPKGLEVILAGSKIDIIQEEVGADELYVNPFSSNGEGVAIGHDLFINHVIKIDVCNQAKRFLEMMALRMMGF